MASEVPVVIIGGGFAGLSTAVELARSGRSGIILERAGYFGGNIRTDNGVDVGVIQIFPWFRCVRQMADFFEHALPPARRTPSVVLNMVGGRPRAHDTPEFMPTSILETLRLSTSAKRIKRAQGIYQLSKQIPLPVDDDATLYDVLYYVNERKAHDFDLILRGYTYPSARELSAHLALGPLFEDLYNNMYNCNLGALVAKMCRFLEARGWSLVKSVGDLSIVRVGPKTSVSYRTADGLRHDLVALDLVMACPLTETLKMMPKLYSLMRAPPQYTKMATALVTVPSDADLSEWLPGFPVWFGAFVDDPLRIVSDNGLRLTTVCRLPGNKFVILYIEDAVEGGSLDPGRLRAGVQQIIRHKAMYPFWEANVVTVNAFPTAMPRPDLGFIESVRKLSVGPKKMGLHFAGQYLGFPCLETACYSGMRAAHEIIGDLPDFDALIES